jgi:hypothetical protein
MTPIYESSEQVFEREFDARRVERERIAMAEARIEVTEYLDAADIVRYFPHLNRSTTA